MSRYWEVCFVTQCGCNSKALFEEDEANCKQNHHTINQGCVHGRGALKSRGGPSAGDITALPSQKRGRPVLLGSSVDVMAQENLKKVIDGGVVSAVIAMTAARGILLSWDKTKQAEFGGYVQLSRLWAYVLFKRMKFV